MCSKVRVLNVVVSGTLGVELNLNAVAKAFPRNAIYRQKPFPCLVFRFKNPKVTILLFRDGKLVCVRAKSKGEAMRSVWRVVELLRSMGVEVGKPKVAVRNIVASADLRSQVDLIGLCERAEIPASKLFYEPEQFPSAVYRMENPHVTFVIFRSGKVICCGAKKTREIHEAFKKFNWLLKEKEVVRCDTKGKTV